MKQITGQLLDELSAAARKNPRLRQNHNLHDSYDDPCQRLLNAIEPGSYIRPHRHLDPPRPECFVAVRGRLAALVFGDDGAITQVLPIAPGSELLGVDIPPGVWHALVALEAGSVFFEAKPGPYLPLGDKDFAPWAPPEGGPEAAVYLRALEAAARAHLCGEPPAGP